MYIDTEVYIITPRLASFIEQHVNSHKI